MREKITIETEVLAPIEKVWACWNNPEHITKWCFASDDWHAPQAASDLRVGGKFTTRMEAKDGSSGFDFGGTYLDIKENEVVEYEMGDNRNVRTTFVPTEKGVKVTETFEAEDQNPIEMQRAGWQSILNNFKKYVEN
jgi:uncharacterized protein YndB with AHSA1/START domain